jgi:hypothetical protein
MPFEILGEGISLVKNFFIDKTPKSTSLGQAASFDALCVQIVSEVWSVRRVTKKGKVR